MFIVAGKWVSGAAILLVTTGMVYAQEVMPDAQMAIMNIQQSSIESSQSLVVDAKVVTQAEQVKTRSQPSKLSAELKRILKKTDMGNSQYVIDFTINAKQYDQFIETLKASNAQKIDSQTTVVRAQVNADQLKTLLEQQALQQADIEGVMPNVTVANSQDLALSSISLSLNLLQRLDQLKGKNNSLIFSPYSIAQTGLALLLANQSPEKLTVPEWYLGQYRTKDKLNSFVMPKLEDSFHVAQYLWIDDRLKLNPVYAKQYKKLINGKLESIDLSNATKTVARINKIIARDTNQRITDLLNPDDLKQLQVLLLNTVYFKAQWQHPFFVTKTRAQPFTDASGDSQMVAMMAEHLPVQFAHENGWTLVELPFNKKGNTLALFLPPPNQPSLLLNESIYHMLNIQKQGQSIHLRLPKIKLVGQRIQVNEWIPELRTWPLDQLLKKGQPNQFTTLHQASVEWDETGAEASAATATMVKRALEDDEDEVVEFNRPFYFMIKDKEEVLFAGEINHLPSASEVGQ